MPQYVVIMEPIDWSVECVGEDSYLLGMWDDYGKAVAMAEDEHFRRGGDFNGAIHEISDVTGYPVKVTTIIEE